MKPKHGGGRSKITVWGPGVRKHYCMIGDTCMKIMPAHRSAVSFFLPYVQEELRRHDSDPEYQSELDKFSIIDGVDFRVKYLKSRQPFQNGIPQNVAPYLKQPHEHIYIFCESELIGMVWKWSEVIRTILEAQDAGAHPEYFVLVAGNRQKFDITTLPGYSIAELQAPIIEARQQREITETRKAHAAKQQPDTTYGAYKASIWQYEQTTAEARLRRRMKRESENEEFE